VGERGEGALPILSLPNRVESRPMPAVKVIDLRTRAQIATGKHYALSP